MLYQESKGRTDLINVDLQSSVGMLILTMVVLLNCQFDRLKPAKKHFVTILTTSNTSATLSL